MVCLNRPDHFPLLCIEYPGIEPHGVLSRFRCSRCLCCRKRFKPDRKDKIYCSIKCQSAWHYAIRRKQKYCIICKHKCSSKYCSLTCKKLMYRLMRNRKAVNRISNIIRVRRHKRAETKYSSTFISTRGSRINQV